MMPERARARHDREEGARDERHAARRHADMFDVERQNRPEAAIDELDAEDHRHQQDEVLERQHAAERHAPAIARLGRGRVRRSFVVQEKHEQQANTVERRRDEKRAAKPDERGEQPADHRTNARSEALRGLHQTDRLRHLLPRRRLRRHRDRDRSVARKQSLRGPQREDVPRARDERHRRHEHHEAHQRALDHDLASEPIRQPPPHRRQQRRQARCDAEAEAGPQRDAPDVRHAELRDEHRQKRHRNREAGVAHEARRSHSEQIAAPREGMRRRDGAGHGAMYAVFTIV